MNPALELDMARKRTAPEEPLPPQAAKDGNMGLRGVWALVANSSAMVVVTVVLFLCLWQVSRMHNEGMLILQKMQAEDRESSRQFQTSMTRALDKQTAAIEALTTELRRTKQ
jgi:hypothetical protein